MADTRLSDLSAASALAGTDLFYVVQSAGSGGAKATGTQLLTLVGTTYLPLAGGTLTGLLTITQATANASVLASTGYSLTGSDATSMVDLAGTWNTSGVPSALKINVTNTASGTGAALLNLQVGGTTKAYFGVDGSYHPGAYASGTPFIAKWAAASGFFVIASHDGATWGGLTAGKIGSNTYLSISSGSYIGFASGATELTAHEITLARASAGVLDQRSGTTAQALRIFGTYTDSSNYERLTLSTTAGSSVNILAETAGTGGDNLNIVLTPAGTGGVVLGANYQQFTEMTAPAAGASNTVRIYAEDNGSGKTRLMAIFPTGVAQQIAIEP